jgi:hypothetical protein
MDPDLDPAIFVIELQDANKILFSKVCLLIILLLEGKFTSCFNDKIIKSREEGAKK